MRGIALLLGALLMELAVPLSLAPSAHLNSTPSSTGCSVSNSSLCGLVVGIVILWNGLAVVLALLSVSAFLLARSALRQFD